MSWQQIMYTILPPKNLEMFRHLVAKQNWNAVYGSTSSYKAYSDFIEFFHLVYNEGFPIKIISKPRKAWKPRLTYNLLNKIKRKDELHAKYVKSRDPSVLKQFRLYRNRLTSSLRAARNSYFTNIFWNVDQRRSGIAYCQHCLLPIYRQRIAIWKIMPVAN